MFCPQCGQQQVSSDVRFCSRCGFQLSVVTELLSTGGVAASSIEQPPPGESPRRRGVRQGMLMFFVGLVATSVFGILFGEGDSSAFPYLLIPLSAVILVLGGLLRMFYALIFDEGKRKAPQEAAGYAHAYAPPAPERVAGPNASALPPAQSIPARAYAPPRAHTAEVRQPPPSVTDNTTRLLKDTPDDATR